MSSSVDVRATCALLLPKTARGAVRWICTKNPFYVLSAGLFLLGLRLSFGTEALEDVWALMGGLAGYTLLLAVTACLLIRFGKVWDDARTVLLLVVLLFLATSVTFDELLLLNRVQGYVCSLLGLLFAVGVSEGLLFTARLRLPALFRVPYYLILALFFLYPPFLSLYADDPHSDAMRWGLFAFSSVAGLIFLTLLPAIRRGARYVRYNGSPWVWPYYPWMLFGVLAFAVVGRAFLLCWSMHVQHLVDYDGLSVGPFFFLMNYEGLIFAPYFLVPFGLALTVLLLEVGLVSSRRVLGFALAAPLGLVLLAQLGHRPDAIYHQFLDLFIARLGGAPLYVTVLAVAVFYAYAALRRVPRATDALTAAIALLAVVGPETLTLDELGPAQPMPLLAAAFLQLGLGFWRREAWRYLLGTFAATAITGLYFGNRESCEVALFVLLLGGARFENVFARLYQSSGAVLALGYCVVVIFAGVVPLESLSLAGVEAYPLVLSALLAGYGVVLVHRLSQGVSAAILLCWLSSLGWRGYGELRQLIAGLDYLALSLLVFALAVLISLAKSGILTRSRVARTEAVSGETG